MRSKTLKHPRKNQSSLWKDELACSEERTLQIARELAEEISLGDRVLLEGPMGVGKTTFAKALLEGFGIHQLPEGSPTFAIAHEYESRLGEVIHLDLYRLKNEEELEDAGVPSYFWERHAIVLAEWTSLFPGFLNSVKKTAGNPGKIWEVQLSFHHSLRSIRVTRLPS